MCVLFYYVSAPTEIYPRSLHDALPICFGLTSAIDAGGTNLPYPDDYQALVNLPTRPEFPIRVSNLLFSQRPGTERGFYEKLDRKTPPLNSSHHPLSYTSSPFTTHTHTV